MDEISCVIWMKMADAYVVDILVAKARKRQLPDRSRPYIHQKELILNEDSNRRGCPISKRNSRA